MDSNNLTQEWLDSIVKFHLEWAASAVRQEAEGYTPELLFVEEKDDGCTYSTLCVLANGLQSGNYAPLFSLGERFGKEQKRILCVTLAIDAWVAVRELNSTDRTQPKDDPNRREAIVVTGYSVNQLRSSGRFFYSRSDGAIHPEPIQVHSSDCKMNNKFLDAFIAGWATAFQAAIAKFD